MYEVIFDVNWVGYCFVGVSFLFVVFVELFLYGIVFGMV